MSNGKRESVEKLFRSLAKKRGLDEARFAPGFLAAAEEKIIENEKNNNNNKNQGSNSKFSTWKAIFELVPQIPRTHISF